MTQVHADISVSLDGYVAGPNPSLDDPLGERGELLHEWVVGLKSWREAHGKEGGETGPDADVVERRQERAGAEVMGRKMFSGGTGRWEDDPNAGGWWGDEPPFGHPVFVLTHHTREPLELGTTTFNFVTDGIEPALEQARAAAGDKDVLVAGGGEAIQQYLSAGLLDELNLSVVPILLGGGTRLLDNLGAKPPALELAETIESPTGVTHLRYRV